VDSYNSYGHKGIFWSYEDVYLFKEAGFEKVEVIQKTYTWNFNSKIEMLDFTRNLFGIDRYISDEDLFSKINEYLHPITENTLPWKLLYFKAFKLSP
jgi:hypothetical protein